MKLSLRFAIFLKALTFSLSIYIFCCISQLFCFIFFCCNRDLLSCFFSPIFFFFQTTPQMKLFVFRPSMNVQRQGRVFEPGGSGGEPPFDSLSNHHSGHQQQQQHHPIYNNSRHAAGEDDPLQVYLKNGIVQSSKTAVFNL